MDEDGEAERYDGVGQRILGKQEVAQFPDEACAEDVKQRGQSDRADGGEVGGQADQPDGTPPRRNVSPRVV
jgi:hypothetical protein